MGISKRIPGWGEIVPVYAVIVLILYTWTILSFFWLVPNWLFFMTISEILTVLAYSFATNLLESVVVLCVCLLSSLVLPAKWFHDAFVARGSALAMAGLGYLIFIAFQFTNKSIYPTRALSVWGLALAAIVIVLIVHFAGRIRGVRQSIEVLAERTTIFLYVMIPLSVLSVILVAFRAMV